MSDVRTRAQENLNTHDAIPTWEDYPTVLPYKLAEDVRDLLAETAGGKHLAEFNGDGVWRDAEGQVWVTQTQATEAVQRVLAENTQPAPTYPRTDYWDAQSPEFRARVAVDSAAFAWAVADRANARANAAEAKITAALEAMDEGRLWGPARRILTEGAPE